MVKTKEQQLLDTIKAYEQLVIQHPDFKGYQIALKIHREQALELKIK